MKNIICPISNEKANENVVRITAFWVIILTGSFIFSPNPYIPLFLLFDFYIRAFTKFRYSPLSWLSARINKIAGLQPNLIDKAPKIFAARIGLVFSVLMFILFILGMTNVAIITGAVLVLFAFLECGLNFCAGCWVYTYVVIPFYRKQ